MPRNAPTASRAGQSGMKGEALMAASLFLDVLRLGPRISGMMPCTQTPAGTRG